MPTFRERLADLLAGDKLADLEASLAQLREVNERMASAYLDGAYSLPPEQLVQQLQEYYDPALVADLVDRLNWEAVSGYGGYSEDERQRAVQDSLRMFKYAIIARWIVNLWTYYGLGVNVSIVAEDEAADEVWQAFWAADRNQRVLAKDRMDELSRWLLVTGERFHVFFASTLDGEATVRSIEPGQISAILTNPDDAAEPWFYERTWTTEKGGQRVLYYPDWELYFGGDLSRAWRQAGEAYTLGGELAQQNQTAACMLFTPFVQLDEGNLRGWPLLAPHGTPWLRAQREFMQDRATVTKAKAAFVRRYSVAGGSRAVDAVRRTLSSAFQFGATSEANPPPVAGSSEVHNRAVDVTDLPMGTGAGDAKNDGEMFAWMAGLAGGVFPHYLGLGDAYRLATACYSDDTEVLTETGWKGWREVNGDKIATYNHVSRCVQYMRPTKLHVYPYKGDMVRITGRSIDAMVTPNHRMLALNENNVSKEWAKTEFEVVKAEELPSRFALPTQAGLEIGERPYIESFLLPAVGIGKQQSRKGAREIPMDDWLRFLGWWITEGWASHAENGGNHEVGIAQKANATDTPSIEKLLERLPFRFNRSTNSNNIHRWRTNDKALYLWLEENCGKHAYEKHLPDFVFALNMMQSRILLDTLWDGDGNWMHDSPHYKGAFFSTSKQLVDDVQALIVNVGDWGAVSVNRKAGEHPEFPDAPTCWIVYRSKQKKRSLHRGNNTTVVPYNGTVWCFEAPPNKMFITRRNGCPLIAGNTSMEVPLNMQFSLYRNQLGAMVRKMVRIVLQFQEQYNGATYESYGADVSTDRLVEADLALTSEAVARTFRDVLEPMRAAGDGIPPEARRRIDVFLLQKLLEALGSQDVGEVLSMDDYETEPEAQEAGMAEQHPGPTPRGQPLPYWEGQVEITPEDVAEAIVRWNQEAAPAFRGLLEAEVEAVEPETEKGEEEVEDE